MALPSLAQRLPRYLRRRKLALPALVIALLLALQVAQLRPGCSLSVLPLSMAATEPDARVAAMLVVTAPRIGAARVARLRRTVASLGVARFPPVVVVEGILKRDAAAHARLFAAGFDVNGLGAVASAQAVAVGHRRTWERIARHNESRAWYLVVEDDVVLQRGQDYSVLRAPPPNAELVTLYREGVQWSWCPATPLYRKVWGARERVRGRWRGTNYGFVAYYVSSRGARSLLRMFPIAHPIDHAAYEAAQSQGLQVYAARETWVGHDDHVGGSLRLGTPAA